MKPWPGARAVMVKAALWGGAAMTAVLVAAWVVSGWCSITYNALPCVCGVSHGAASFIPEHPGARYLEPGFHAMRLSRVQFPKNWFLSIFELNDVGITIHCGLLAAPFAVVACIGWRLELLARRARAGLCPRCRYDLRSTPHQSPCPECGSPQPRGTTTA